MSFDLQPHLRGELVELRPMVPDDFETLYDVARDPLIWEQHPASDRYTRPVFTDYFDGGLKSGGGLVILDRATGQMIGATRYNGYDPDKSEVEIGWTFLARAYWGGKYNNEVKALMLAHAFAYVDRVNFMVGANNIRSQKAVERIGARRAGERTDAEGRTQLLYVIDRI